MKLTIVVCKIISLIIVIISNNIRNGPAKLNTQDRTIRRNRFRLIRWLTLKLNKKDLEQKTPKTQFNSPNVFSHPTITYYPLNFWAFPSYFAFTRLKYEHKKICSGSYNNESCSLDHSNMDKYNLHIQGSQLTQKNVWLL